jgi:AcrR family transcriptional regulator
VDDQVQLPRQRQTRAEARVETRRRLLEAALTVFLAKGFAAASVEEIAAQAGYTRGAFYSNFRDKDDVFFALMDEREEHRVAQVTHVMETSSPLTVFSDLQAWSESERDADTSRIKLFADFRAHALRNEPVRLRLAERDRALRLQYERAITGLFNAAGVPAPAPVADLAVVVQLLDTFLPLQQAFDETIRKSLLFDTLTLLFRAAVALGERDQP